MAGSLSNAFASAQYHLVAATSSQGTEEPATLEDQSTAMSLAQRHHPAGGTSLGHSLFSYGIALF
eukprot:1887010-Amphidinium_carterae.1